MKATHKTVPRLFLTATLVYALLLIGTSVPARGTDARDDDTDVQVQVALAMARAMSIKTVVADCGCAQTGTCACAAGCDCSACQTHTVHATHAAQPAQKPYWLRDVGRQGWWLITPDGSAAPPGKFFQDQPQPAPQYVAAASFGGDYLGGGFSGGGFSGGGGRGRSC